MKGVEDEQEKNWVVDVLVEKGGASLEPAQRYMKTAEQLAFPLRVLERIADHDSSLKVVDELFATEPPGYVAHARAPHRSHQVVHRVEARDRRRARRAHHAVPARLRRERAVHRDRRLARAIPTKIAGPLIDALVRPEEESGRIRRTIVEVLEKTKAPLGGRGKAVAAMLTGPLADDFKVDGDVVKKR